MGHHAQTAVINIKNHQSALTMHNAKHHIAFTQDGTNVHITGMRASVDNTVHVKIQMVKLGQERRVGYNLIDLGVSFRYPSVKLLTSMPIALDDTIQEKEKQEQRVRHHTTCE
jgi:hypothetical protein